jgi:hypothetical protein
MKQRHRLVRPSECGTSGSSARCAEGSGSSLGDYQEANGCGCAIEYSYRVGEVARYLPAQEKKRHSHL